MRSTYGWLHPSEPAASANNGNHDARLLHTIVLGSSRAHYGTPLMDARDDVIAVNVRRHRHQ